MTFEPPFDVDFSPSNGSLKFLTTKDFFTCRVIGSPEEPVRDIRSINYCPELPITCARLLHLNPSRNGFVVGLSDGRVLAVLDAADVSEKDTFSSCTESLLLANSHSFKRMHSPNLRLPVKEIVLISREFILVAYQGGRKHTCLLACLHIFLITLNLHPSFVDVKEYFQIALWRMEDCTWLWHVGQSGVLDWSWQVVDDCKELTVALSCANGRTVQLYRFDLGSTSSAEKEKCSYDCKESEHGDTPFRGGLSSDNNNFVPLAKPEFSWPFDSVAVEQVKFAAKDCLVARSDWSLEVFMNDGGPPTWKHQRSLEISSDSIWTGSLGVVLIGRFACGKNGCPVAASSSAAAAKSSTSSISLLNTRNNKLLKLPIPGRFSATVLDAIVGPFVCQVLTPEGILVFDLLNGELMSHHRISGIKKAAAHERGTYKMLNFDQKHGRTLVLFNTDPGDRHRRFHVLQFTAATGESIIRSQKRLTSSNAAAGSAKSKKPSSSSSTAAPTSNAIRAAQLRNYLKEWQEEGAEEDMLDSLRRKFNMDDMSEEQMIQLAILLSSGGEGNEAAPIAASNDFDDADLELALKLSLEEQ